MSKHLEDAAQDYLETFESDDPDYYIQVVALISIAESLAGIRAMMEQGRQPESEPMTVARAIAMQSGGLVKAEDVGELAEGNVPFDAKTYADEPDADQAPADDKTFEEDSEPIDTPAVCVVCGRERTADDPDYNPMQLVLDQPVGWYSSQQDGEICPECNLSMFRKANGLSDEPAN